MNKKLIIRFSTLLILFGISASCSTDSTPVYILKTSVSPDEGGSVSPDQGEFDSGTEVEIMASPNEHWVFQKWEGDQNGTANPATVTMNSDKDLMAIFIKREYPLTLTTEGEGTVGEAVVQAKSTDYPHGTMVELTANAAEGWSFVEWQGDLTGNDNPETILIEDEKSVTAIFERQNYGLTISTEGEGSVTEVVVQAKTTDYAFETEVILTATAENGWGFRAWKGAVNSTENPLTVQVRNDMEITAVFNECVTDNCLDIYYTKESVLTRKYYFHNDYSGTYSGWHKPLEAVVIDYDQDGYFDLVHTNSDYDASFDDQEVRNYIQFFKGDSQGNLSLDQTMSSNFVGLIHGRKGLVGDYNNNGYPDIFFAGAGTDVHPFPGEYPILLLNDEGQGFTETRFTDLIGFWHSVSSGDINNDGNLDIVLPSPQTHGESYILINDGTGNFDVQTNFIHPDLLGGLVTSELFDVDKDGYLDLVLTGHDNTDFEESIIIYGNGYDFLGDYIALPTVYGYGIAVDIQFYDIDGNGKEEILINRTGDGSTEDGPGGYEGWYIQVLERSGGEYIDSTGKFISGNSQESGSWLEWLNISDRNNDGIINLYSNEVTSEDPRPKVEWELSNGKFVRIN
ncbi:MAG: VCBS repeat-containing protein [Balneolaceae bacterium]